jgi:hypothetical protein
MALSASSFWFWDRPSWGQAEVWAVVFLLVPSLLVRRDGRSFLASLINGADNRWSTSKMSVVLWTYGLLFAFLTIILHTRGVGVDKLDVPDQYLLLLAIPAGRGRCRGRHHPVEDPERPAIRKAEGSGATERAGGRRSAGLGRLRQV